MRKTEKMKLRIRKKFHEAILIFIQLFANISSRNYIVSYPPKKTLFDLKFRDFFFATGEVNQASY